MCDTLVALGDATADGSVILAKNSDRSPNEAQYPFYVPHMAHAESMVQCTHIAIPQVPETLAVLLSRPFWMWGCEMGVNEHGVAIGNEAVFTREPKARSGLLGMDLMRLALERADTARRALEVITDLIARYGQGGICDIYHRNITYHNSFIIADPGEAWVLETAGYYWVAKQVRDVYSISNCLTIGRDWDLASPGVVEHAIDKGWCKSESDFDFARCYSDRFFTRITSAQARHRRTSELLRAHRGKITPAQMFAFLRDHGDQHNSRPWSPERGGITVCMHAANNLARRSQSVASLVAHLRADLPTYWMTGTSAPCTGVFKPLYMGPLPSGIGRPEGQFDEGTLWWRHERLHRAVLADYATRMPLYAEERDGLEASFVAEEQSMYEHHRDDPDALAEFSQLCFEQADLATRHWYERVRAAPIRRRAGFFYRRYWIGQGRKADIE